MSIADHEKMKKVRELLRCQETVLCDGAMGTVLYSRGIYVNQCFEALNLSRPELVVQVHQDYLDAGAQILETNTFGANAVKLQPFGLAEQVAEINSTGVKLARQVVGDQAFVAGSVGPLGKPIEPYGTLAKEQAVEAFLQQVEALVEGGVDLVILETFSDLEELRLGIRAVRELSPEIPLIAQMTIGENLQSSYGLSAPDIASALDQEPIDALGLNCSVGPSILLQAIELMRPLTKKPLSAQPNAGLPERIGGRLLYLSTPEYMAEYARRMVLKGVNILGGCCGSTPEHIRSIASMLRSLSPGRTMIKVEETPRPQLAEHKPEVPLAARSQLARKIAQELFVTSIEIDPPLGTNPQQTIEGARLAFEANVDAINIADGPRASPRMSPLALALLFQQKVGIETILHYCCRDRNILGMQSDLLGAHSLGIRNLLIITGDPPKVGDYPWATGVYDVDSIGLVRMVKRLNQGLDLAGKPVGEPTSFFIGVGANPGAIDLELELGRFQEKVKSGAEYVLTQPVFDVGVFQEFLRRIEAFKIPVLVGILPLYSYRNAEFLHNEVPGMQIPEEIRERMRGAGTGEEARREGVKIAQEALRETAPLCQGAYLMPPFGKVELALQVLEVL